MEIKKKYLEKLERIRNGKYTKIFNSTGEFEEHFERNDQTPNNNFK